MRGWRAAAATSLAGAIGASIAVHACSSFEDSTPTPDAGSADDARTEAPPVDANDASQDGGVDGASADADCTAANVVCEDFEGALDRWSQFVVSPGALETTNDASTTRALHVALTSDEAGGGTASLQREVKVSDARKVTCDFSLRVASTPPAGEMDILRFTLAQNNTSEGTYLDGWLYTVGSSITLFSAAKDADGGALPATTRSGGTFPIGKWLQMRFVLDMDEGATGQLTAYQDGSKISSIALPLRMTKNNGILLILGMSSPLAQRADYFVDDLVCVLR